MKRRHVVVGIAGPIGLNATYVPKARSTDFVTPAPLIGQADAVVVRKGARELDLLRDGKVAKSCPVALGFVPAGHKTREGDGKTPEGNYLIDWCNPNSRFHLSLHISYPNAADRKQARERGVSPGGDIFIHGNSVAGAFRRDWTLGCIAVTDTQIKEIRAAVPNGAPISILSQAGMCRYHTGHARL